MCGNDNEMRDLIVFVDTDWSRSSTLRVFLEEAWVFYGESYMINVHCIFREGFLYK